MGAVIALFFWWIINCVVWAILFGAEEYVGVAFFLGSISSVLIPILIGKFQLKEVERKKSKAFPIIYNVVNQHKEALYLKYKQLKHIDAYGNEILDSFIKELDYFASSVLIPHLKSQNIQYEQWVKDEYISHVSKTIDALIATIPSSVAVDDIQNGYEYEQFVSDLFENIGYAVEITPKTGDQGVDLIADKGGYKVAVQCKFYSKPVGNSAVQQIYGGAQYYDAHMGCVIAPKGFTKSALQLADSLNILCLHHDEINSYFSVADDLVSEEESINERDMLSLAEDFMSESKFPQAIQYLEALINLDEYPSYAYVMLGDLYSLGEDECKNKEKALLYYNKAKSAGYWYVIPSMLSIAQQDAMTEGALSTEYQAEFKEYIQKYSENYKQIIGHTNQSNNREAVKIRITLYQFLSSHRNVLDDETLIIASDFFDSLNHTATLLKKEVDISPDDNKLKELSTSIIEEIRLFLEIYDPA